MRTVGWTLQRFRQPEYTGENRCLPCTAVNLAIAFVIAGGIATISVGVAAVVLVGFLATIYSRGYLIPGTPALTKRYFPDRVLRLFDKQSRGDQAVSPAAELDVEANLREANAVTDCDHIDDLCLTEAFRAAWHDRITVLRTNDTLRQELAAILGLDSDTLDFQEYGDAVVATTGGTRVGQWESRAAFLADIAAANELRERSADWAGLPVQHRGQLLNGLRIFLEQCPVCQGPVTIDQEVVESCCRSIDVVAVTCDHCEARLFEAERPSA